MSQVTGKYRNDKVREVLLAASEPIGPTEIARRIGEEWCCWGGTPSGAHSAAISPVCKRIGAINNKGKYSLPKDGAA